MPFPSLHAQYSCRLFNALAAAGFQTLPNSLNEGTESTGSGPVVFFERCLGLSTAVLFSLA